MLVNTETKFGKQTLIERSTGRYFDRITVATNRIPELVKNMTEMYDLRGWECGCNDIESYGRCWFENVELRLVDAADDAFPVKSYFAAKGEGICCVRENVPAERWESEKARYEKLGIKVIYTEKEGDDETLWLDTVGIWGGYFAIHSAPFLSAEDIPGSNPRHMCQINITTDDVDRTVAELTAILEIGPWSVGTLNNRTITDPGLLVDGEMVSPEFHFQLGITFFSNIEFEVIQPVKGPTVYRSFIDSHGVGYHHIKEVVPLEKWQETLDYYTDKGLNYVIKGQVGPTAFAYLNSEKEFGFISELGDGLPADPLPDGYNEYWYPSN